jgi:hypothetical protein
MREGEKERVNEEKKAIKLPEKGKSLSGVWGRPFW